METQTKPPNPNGYSDPYFSLAKKDKTRTTIDVANVARSEAFAAYGNKKGALQTTLNILLDKFHKEVQRVGLTKYDPERFELAVSGLEIKLGGFGYIIVDQRLAHIPRTEANCLPGTNLTLAGQTVPTRPDSIQRSPASNPPSRRKRAVTAKTPN